MINAILNFPKQFGFAPKILNKANFKRRKKFIVLGMGGSHLAADILLSYNPALPIIIRSDYGLPQADEKELAKTLIIASSYSGNTEEVIDGLQAALAKNLNVAVTAVGGKLIDIAKEKNLPYVQLPDTGIQPRSALGYSIMALLKVMNVKEGLKEAKALKKILNPKASEQAGRELASRLKNFVPVIYASARNRAVAYNWKIKFNETGKIPSFYNVVPELNHNEMTGLDVKDATKKLSDTLYFIFLKDSADDARVQKRMDILKTLYQDRGLPVEVIEMSGASVMAKIFSSLVLADWAATYTAEQYGLDPEQVPMVEEFKKQMQ
ncbi:bifunctional phosphoglucose/phosphomannose isomerase [Candidatus Falkowbacteria bacterium RIFOXYA2_FULL_47_9]|uniref:Bifunctional phosphoglucose/phosphomannose isomerase n=1 Tax=Candidatus Falkowbacteria bacterium RIFOXYA2_FULL_47_9 TaxID=1797995 RepID=A0A1F5SIL2_9BACT|nr:MAG: bifunctional phosphoglucose/phosphomannose isomerase [Candidatus Falkowbacteria bacterium RIFOXYA2_FULL_47_9]